MIDMSDMFVGRSMCIYPVVVLFRSTVTTTYWIKNTGPHLPYRQLGKGVSNVCLMSKPEL